MKSLKNKRLFRLLTVILVAVFMQISLACAIAQEYDEDFPEPPLWENADWSANGMSDVGDMTDDFVDIGNRAPAPKASDSPIGMPHTTSVDVPVPMPIGLVSTVSAPQEVPTKSTLPKNTSQQADVPSQVELDYQKPSNLFYDANDIQDLPAVPQQVEAGPVRMDPAQIPASRMIKVTKDKSSTTYKARLMAAQRARDLGRHDSAVTIYEGLIAKNARDPAAWMGYALTLQKAGRTDDAIEAYQNLLDLRPDNLNAQINMIGLMGEFYPAVSLQKLLELSEAYPNNMALVAQVAVTHARLDNFEDALEYYGIIAASEPENANHIYNMAVIADRQGNRAGAMKYYEKALEIDSIYGHGKTIPRTKIYERLARIR